MSSVVSLIVSSLPLQFCHQDFSNGSIRRRRGHGEHFIHEGIRQVFTTSNTMGQWRSSIQCHHRHAVSSIPDLDFGMEITSISVFNSILTVLSVFMTRLGTSLFKNWRPFWHNLVPHTTTILGKFRWDYGKYVYVIHVNTIIIQL